MFITYMYLYKDHRNRNTVCKASMPSVSCTTSTPLTVLTALTALDSLDPFDSLHNVHVIHNIESVTYVTSKPECGISGTVKYYICSLR